MADDIETVSVEAPAKRSRRPPFDGLSPLQAGLLYGGAASTVMGPAGLLVGLGAGILAQRQRKNFLDREAATVENIEGERQALLDQIATEYEGADPDERRLLDHARRVSADGYQRLMAGDPLGEKLLDQANAVILGIKNADSAARKADEAAALGFQRQLIGGAAESYRKEYQQALGDHDTIQHRTARVFDLLAQPDFDPNSPLNKAAIGDLIMDGMGMYRDTPDAWDAISRGAGAFSGIAGAAVEGLAAFMKSEDFKIRREDYYRIALNLRQFADQQARSRMDQIGGQARELDSFARRTKSIADDYSLGDYISGGVDELRLLPVPKVAPTPTVIDQARQVIGADTPTEQLGTRRLQSAPTTRKPTRPVNGSGLLRGPPL